MLKPAFYLAILITIVSFILNLGWELAQCQVFFVHESLKPTLGNMVGATLGDVLMTWLSYAFTSAVSGDVLWLFKKNGETRAWLAVESAALILGVAVEKIGMSLGRWAYTSQNPTIPFLDVSVVPVLQLAVLFPLTFFLSAWLLRKKLC